MSNIAWQGRSSREDNRKDTKIRKPIIRHLFDKFKNRKSHTTIKSPNLGPRNSQDNLDIYSDNDEDSSTAPSLGLEILPNEKLVVTKEDFEPIVRLGKGSFATVILVRSVLAKRIMADRRQQKKAMSATGVNPQQGTTDTESSSYSQTDKWSFLRKLLPKSNDLTVRKECAIGSSGSEDHSDTGSERSIDRGSNTSGKSSSKRSTCSTLSASGYGRKGDLFAMKIIPKKKLLDVKRVRDVFTERDILFKSSHPFLIKLHHTFQSPKKLFFIVDYMPGGNLRQLVSDFRQRKVRMPYEMVRLYAAQVTLAIIHLHENKIIYRDLKPENILLDERGHCALADFGLSKDFGDPVICSGDDGYLSEKRNSNFPVEDGSWYNTNTQNSSAGLSRPRTNSFVGSPLYVAPEVLRREKYSFEVDFWGLGVLIYTLLFGAEPFRSSNPKEVFGQILAAEVRFPNSVHATEAAVSIVSSLLIKNPMQRLKDPDILAHPFFHGIDMNEVYNRRIVPEGFTCPPPPTGLFPEDNTNTIRGTVAPRDTELEGKFSELHESVVPQEGGEEIDHFEDFTMNVLQEDNLAQCNNGSMMKEPGCEPEMQNSDVDYYTKFSTSY